MNLVQIFGLLNDIHQHMVKMRDNIETIESIDISLVDINEKLGKIVDHLELLRKNDEGVS